MKLVVKQSHVDYDSPFYGKNYCNIRDCPVARAIKEQYPELGTVTVGPSGTIYSEKGPFHYDNNLWDLTSWTDLPGYMKLVRKEVETVELELTPA